MTKFLLHLLMQLIFPCYIEMVPIPIQMEKSCQNRTLGIFFHINKCHLNFYGFVENQDINMPIKMEVEEEKKAHSPMVGLTGQILPSNSWHNCRRLIYVPRSAQKGYSVGHWPIPEAFWPDSTNSTLVSWNIYIYIAVVFGCCFFPTVYPFNLIGKNSINSSAKDQLLIIYQPVMWIWF